MSAHYLKLCLVTNIQNRSWHEYKHFIVAAVQGGVSVVQFREKNKKFSENYILAKEIQSILRPFNVPFIINDNVALAKEINADGVHLGQTDMPVNEARQIIGQNKIIGLSIESLDELDTANKQTDINYVAISAVFPSKTKRDCKTIWGIERFKTAVQYSKNPVIAIGGINIDNIEDIIQSGACGAAVVSAIQDAPEPQKAATELLHAINRMLNKIK